MKTSKIYRIGFATLWGLLVFTLAACGNPAGPAAERTPGLPQGMGLARISLAGTRTVVSNISAYYFTLTFSAAGKTAVVKTLDGGLSLAVPLEPAVWNLEVKGYSDSNRTKLKVTGKTSASVAGGAASNFTVYLTPDYSSGGKGSLSYSVTFPAAARGRFGLYPLEVSGITDEEFEEIDISSAAAATKSDILSDLPEGSYLAVVDLYDTLNNRAAVWTRAVHIYDKSTAALNLVFTAADFAACPPVVGEHEGTLAAKLDAALASPAGSYTVVLTGTETDLGGFTARELKATNNKDITVTLRGGGETVQLSGTGSLFTIAADVGAALTLVLQDLTLKGVSNNAYSALVKVGDQGTLEMKTGSIITGNIATSGAGGVEVIAKGTFIMNGGAVSRNSPSGVFCSGKFIMNDGAVKDNSTGGGVLVYGDASFTMSGGVISGNSASYLGGGALIYGTFIMNGGAVSGNSSGDGGGGVGVSYGTFTMNGGTIRANSAFHVSSSPSGGGVYVHEGTFILNNGEVTGNYSSGPGGGVAVVCYTDSSTSTFTMHNGKVSGNSASSGGGVLVSTTKGTSTFTMNNGEISNNTATGMGGGVSVGTNGNFTMANGKIIGNSASAGGGVFVSGTSFTMSGGEVSGNSAGMGGGVFFATSSGIFTMSGGTVAGNIPGEGRGKEVIVLGSSPLILSGDAKPERVLLYGSTSFIKIAGPLTGGSPPIALDLGITDSDPLANWVNKPILQLDASYNTGNLASLKDNFTLGNTQVTDKEPYTETAISGYKIADDGKFVSE